MAACRENTERAKQLINMRSLTEIQLQGSIIIIIIIIIITTTTTTTTTTIWIRPSGLFRFRI